MRAIREDNRYGGIRAIMWAHFAEARIHVQIAVGFGDAITPAATDMNVPTLLDGMAPPNVLAYPNQIIFAEKAEALLAMAARRWTFDGVTLVAALAGHISPTSHVTSRR